MAGFTKLCSSIITSSIWSEDDKTRIMWVTMLATADAHGYVPGAVPGMAAIARMTMEEAERSIQRLCEPDPYSRTKDLDGRRIVPVDGGWKIVNYEKYREMDRPVRASLDMEGYVYYAGVLGGDSIKIGFSKNPWARLSDLRVVNPHLEILATEKARMAREKERHEQFAADRIEGEWFKATPSLCSLVAALAERDSRPHPTTTVVTTGKPSVATEPQKSTTVAAEAEAEADIPLYPLKGTTTKRIRKSIREEIGNQPCKRCNGKSGKPVTHISRDDNEVPYGLCDDCIKPENKNPQTPTAPI
ncbi:MAG: GIY-YIG nuclease family protein [Planctomycetaceae bacterium]|nr:GIY-YIG nuclease family protein [Planctomycetaceae bacterium]